MQVGTALSADGRGVHSPGIIPSQTSSFVILLFPSFRSREQLDRSISLRLMLEHSSGKRIEAERIRDLRELQTRIIITLEIQSASGGLRSGMWQAILQQVNPKVDLQVWGNEERTIASRAFLVHDAEDPLDPTQFLQFFEAAHGATSTESNAAHRDLPHGT